MRNIIKYPPLEWRKRDEYCVPQGPSFTSAPWITIPISGSRLRLKAPSHSPQYRSVEQMRLLPEVDLLDGRSPLSYGHGVMANDHWGYATGLRRVWAFWGPWMTGCKAELSMSVAVLGRQSGLAFSDISFFHPRAFEMVLVSYLNDRYGHDHWDVNAHIPRWHGPVDWERHSNLPVFAGSCKIYNQGPNPDITNNLSNPDHLLFFPITDEHFVQIRFVQDIYSYDEGNNIAFDTAPIQALQDAIFNSITLELSPQAQASYDKIKSEVGNMQLTKEFAPLQWPTPPPEPGAEKSEAEPEVLKRDGVFIGR